MPRGFRFRVAHVVIAWALLTAGFALGVSFMPRGLFVETINAMLAVIGAGVVALYAPSVVRTCLKPVDGAFLLRAGIVANWSSVAVISARILWLEENQRVTFGLFGGFRCYLVVMGIFGAVLHVLALGALEGRTVRSTTRLALGLLAVGALVGLALAGARRL